MNTRRRGFARADLLTALVCLAFAAVVLSPVQGRLSLASRSAGSEDNLRSLAIANASFAADHDDTIANFDWRALDPMVHNGNFVRQPPYDMGNGVRYTPKNTYEASQGQACFIIRYATRRDENHPKPITIDFNIMPQRRFLYLTMLPYLGGTLPSDVAASPLDKHLFEWRANPFDYDALPGGDPKTASSLTWSREQVLNRWPYASSYQSTVYAWSPDAVGSHGSLPLAPAGDGTRIGIMNPRSCTAQRPMTDVVTPSRKVFLFEEFDYTTGLGVNGTHYTNAEATVAVQFFDGSVRRVTTRDANPGWDPRRPGDKTATAEIRYRPIDSRYFPDDTGLAQPNAGYYKWTRDGLRGTDVNPESP